MFSENKVNEHRKCRTLLHDCHVPVTYNIETNIYCFSDELCPCIVGIRSFDISLGTILIPISIELADSSYVTSRFITSIRSTHSRHSEARTSKNQVDILGNNSENRVSFFFYTIAI